MMAMMCESTRTLLAGGSGRTASWPCPWLAWDGAEVGVGEQERPSVELSDIGGGLLPLAHRLDAPVSDMNLI